MMSERRRLELRAMILNRVRLAERWHKLADLDAIAAHVSADPDIVAACENPEVQEHLIERAIDELFNERADGVLAEFGKPEGGR
jgi:hypothetical protein